MTYELIYNKICIRGKNRKYNKKKHHRHHIIPRCMGGEDIDNISYLTPKEHYLCHRLLTRIYPEDRNLKFAFRMMLGYNDIQFSSRAYQEACEGITQSEESKRKTSIGLKGVKKSKKAIENNRLAHIGQIPWNKGKKTGVSPKLASALERMQKNNRGKKRSEEVKVLISKKARARMFERRGYLLQLDLSGGLIRKYYSIREVNAPFNPNSIEEALRTKSGRYKGYHWKYER